MRHVYNQISGALLAAIPGQYCGENEYLGSPVVMDLQNQSNWASFNTHIVNTSPGNSIHTPLLLELS